MIDGKPIIAPFLSPDEWEELRTAVKSRQKELRFPCCHNTGHLRTSKLGTNHFAHNRRNGCEWEPETVEHLKAKTEIALACRDAGYDVATEAAGSGWRADVLASKGSAQVAFEVQWSRQSLEETQQRQERYHRDGVRGCWFFRNPPKEAAPATKELPLFCLTLESRDNAESFEVQINNPSLKIPQPSYRLREYIKSLLNRRIRFCTQLRARREQNLRIVFIEMECWRCKKISHVYYVSQDTVSSCGEKMHTSADCLEFDESLIKAVSQFINSPEGSHLRLGKIKPRFSKAFGSSYQSFGCFYCDALFGNRYVLNDTLCAMHHEMRSEYSPAAVLETIIPLPDPLPIESGNHWCFPESGDFCE